MADVEYVLRFLMLAGTWRRFSGDFARSMDEFMERNQNASPAELDGLRLRFSSSLARCEEILGDHAFKRPEGGGWRDQVLGGLYDAQMIAFSEISSEQFERLRSDPDSTVEAIKGLFRDEEFENAVRVGTNTPSRIRRRIESMIATLEQAAL